MEPLKGTGLEFVLLTLFILFTSIMTLIEGIYKSGNLLFNCKDDNLLLALPLKKSTVLFVRIMKFYVFELLYNSLFLLPAMVVYACYVKVGVTYYIVSLIALLLLPIIPVVVSCIIGGIISMSSAKFKLKNIAQTIITTLFLLVILYISFNLEGIIGQLAQKASSINDMITSIYYPAGAYIKLITDFNILDLFVFILVNLSLFAVLTILLGKIYFKINSNVKMVKTTSKSSKFTIKVHSPIKALMRKELNKFVNSPVFVTNAGFGLVLFIVGCILAIIKFDSITQMLTSQDLNITIEQIKEYIPVFLFGFICFTSLMSSITSSMISLEGKSFNILKSLPISPFKIILSKILTAIMIMIPFILVGDFIVFAKFSFNILEICVILISSIILPLVAETIGILVNLKYPKMDAENDTEVVKQSMSSTVAVFGGIVLLGITIYGLYKCLINNITPILTILFGLGIYIIIFVCLLIYLNKKGVKEFNMINV